MIDPSSSEEETDEEGVEEHHHSGHHHSGHHSQRAAGKVQDVSGGSFGVVGGGANNSFGPAPGQLAGSGGGNLGGGNGAGASSGNTAATSFGGGASNSLDVPPSSSSQPRYVEKRERKSIDSSFVSLFLCWRMSLSGSIRSSTKLQGLVPLTPFQKKLIHVCRDVNAEEMRCLFFYFDFFSYLILILFSSPFFLILT